MKKILKNPTFFVDIDGTIIKYRNFKEILETEPEPIQDVIDYLNEQYDKGSVIIITTARPSIYQEFTKNELEKIGLKYHQIVMDCGRGTRVIFNDKDPEAPEIERAIGINFIRNGGFIEIGGAPNVENYESN